MSWVGMNSGSVVVVVGREVVEVVGFRVGWDGGGGWLWLFWGLGLDGAWMRLG